MLSLLDKFLLTLCLQGFSARTPMTATTAVRRPQTTAFPQETKVKKTPEVPMQGYNLQAIPTGCYDK